MSERVPTAKYYPIRARRKPGLGSLAALVRAIDFLQQLRAKVMIIDFNHMPESFLETPVRQLEFPLYTVVKIMRPAQYSRNLQGRDTRLMIGQPPNASDRLE